jgi:hypothetical protein
MAPAYYQSTDGKLDVIEVMHRFGIEEGLKMQALQYLFRAGKKPGESEVADLKKAISFLQRRIEHLSGAEPTKLIPDATTHELPFPWALSGLLFSEWLNNRGTWKEDFARLVKHLNINERTRFDLQFGQTEWFFNLKLMSQLHPGRVIHSYVESEKKSCLEVMSERGTHLASVSIKNEKNGVHIDMLQVGFAFLIYDLGFMGGSLKVNEVKA